MQQPVHREPTISSRKRQVWTVKIQTNAKAMIPGKKSLFERQKAEAEAKRIKDQQETAAVYEDFVKSFDHEEEEDGSNDRSGTSSGPLSKRHFPPTNGLGRSGSGRGRGSGPGSLGPSPAFSKKRPFEPRTSHRDNLQGAFAYDEPERRDVKSAFQHDEDDEIDQMNRTKAQEMAAAKPTLQLSSLPPGTSVAVVKSLVSGNLTMDGVKFISSGLSERQGTTAIVTLSEGTSIADIDSAVSSLQSRYLGWGFYLSIARHLSSAVINSNLPIGTSSTLSPFGAKTISTGPQYSLSRAPPPGQRGFAPPSSYGPGGPRSSGPTQVNVKPPTNLKQLKLIHKTVESIITHGPEFEALLMSRSEVQRDEKWAWLWNPRSEGGVYYRWRLWDILTNAQQRLRSGPGRNDGQVQAVFETGSRWCMPESTLPYEYATMLEEVVSNSDYDSSEDEDSGNEGRKRLERLQGGGVIPESAVAGENDIPAYLNPIHKAKLVHLLSRLPTTTARLRRGDVARITAFAISHAGAGADEIVSLLTLNVHHPFNRIISNIPKDPDEMDTGVVDDREREDPASSKLIALYLVSDILSSSSTSGVRHAWRYRALFEAALQSHNTFVHLGRLEKELSWGKLRAEKWKRSVLVLLSLWEGWCVFPAKSQEGFVEIFNNPPLSEEEQLVIAREEKERIEKEKTKSKWKAVTADEMPDELGEEDDRADATSEDLDGEPMMDEDLDGELMVDEKEEEEDGEPMIVEDMVSKGIEVQEPPDREPSPAKDPISAAQESRRRRPKAEDMFADPVEN